MTKKEKAQDFLRLASKGQSREAFQLYVGENFKHHNVYFKGDGPTLMTAMEEAAKKNPDKIFEIQRALEDENLVAVHSHVRQTPNDLGVAVIHIFRFDQDKIVELWDFGQAVPADTVNENGMF
ncbi:nuclear transport factor 2 family protein [Chitinophagaceae bacterium LB-8]|uniref:Nuclear transport factor 2 family protein n=1 Tax=Paraflavisolibacter caeni TaxID=2982496 RepID=A0A9X2XY88_9BACT|nr:nuclear transport factor 2 family protein [Paraflavisolibacter caeni]MCU7551400.1 nuclear transport factor 2 family protein [Paraflavisolibacter caeni]